MASGGVRGRRGPRWALWSRFTIPCPNGEDYLVRLRIVQTPWFGVYLHDIHQDDGDRAPHNHPWSFVSIVLRGHYVERLYPDPTGEPTHYVKRRYERWSMHWMGRDTAHRIVHASPGLKTLIVTGPRPKGGSWGFFVDGCLVDWSEYERHQSNWVPVPVAEVSS